MKIILFFCLFINSAFAITARVENCSSSLRVRSLPSIESKIVGKLNCNTNTHVQIVGLEKKWVTILYLNKISYVHGDYLEQIPEYKISSIKGSIVKGLPKKCKSWVNIRSGPGDKYPVLGGLYCDNEINVLGKQEKWFQVEYGKKVGFIFEEKLEIK